MTRHEPMKKSETVLDDDMLPEYDFRGGERVKFAFDDDPLDREIEFKNPRLNPFALAYGRNRNLRILAPDLLAVFPDSESVNEALHTLVRVAAASVATPLKRSAKTAAAPRPKKKKARA